ncbi:MAG TPA: glutamine--fructose-6-phosphate transaminase (isomerizing) [Nitrososphaeraceae archaeon]|nr:glutamine--fructose-6-phosphate transaminase (isomerizing) [Nitrososphaeraceae archaeon]
MMTVVCSIIGYRGSAYAAPLLVESLGKMEYRGYDSVGIATMDNGKLLVKKDVGKVEQVSKTLDLKGMPGQIGIGHTRWATHGGLTNKNAHPHEGCTSEIAVVHNGIIENYKELKKELIASGHSFKSETDSEVIAHLLEEFHSKFHDKVQAIIQVCNRLHGAYAFVAIFGDGTICGSRYDEPLIVGLSNDGYFISSDVLGFLQYTDKAIFLDNKDVALITEENLTLYDSKGEVANRSITQVAWELGAADKGIYAHHTLKEIHEQKESVLRGMVQDEEDLKRFCDILLNAKSIYITGSGTSYHSALLAKHIFEKMAKRRIETVISSDFQDALDLIDDKTVILAISQSGETADVLNSVKLAKELGTKILSIVNINTSSLARLSDSFLTVNCGPEIGVAATKSFTGQLSVFYTVLDTMFQGVTRIKNLQHTLISSIQARLSSEEQIIKIADLLKDVNDLYILGRSLHFPIALEGALKIKELTYVHAEGMAAGEIKHGRLALINNNSIVVVINPTDNTYYDILSSARELKLRGATIIGISDKLDEAYDHFIRLPNLVSLLYPLIEIIPLQLLAYYLALRKNIDPDYPRNLAKSVTVK